MQALPEASVADASVWRVSPKGGSMADNDKDLTERGAENSLEGKGKDVKGKVKDAWGGLTGDTGTQAEGKVDQAKGKVQDTFGKAERKIDRNI